MSKNSLDVLSCSVPLKRISHADEDNRVGIMSDWTGMERPIVQYQIACINHHRATPQRGLKKKKNRVGRSARALADKNATEAGMFNIEAHKN
jgi:hypothetical protein